PGSARLEFPAAVAADRHRHRLVALGVERLEHRASRRERDLVFARPAARDHGDPNPAPHARPSPAAAPAGRLPATAPAKPAPSLLAGSVEPTPACPAPPPSGATRGTVLSGPVLPILCPPAPHR